MRTMGPGQRNTWQNALKELHMHGDHGDDKEPLQPRAMPADFYLSEDLTARETEQLFVQGWICVGRTDEVENSGDYYTLNVFDEPLVVIRTDNNEVKVLSNVCRHRGSVVMQDSGNTRKLSCPYHKWTYALDGKLLAAPLLDSGEHAIDKKTCALPSFRTAFWMGFIFVNLDGKAEAFEDHIVGLDAYVKNYHVEQMRTVQVGPETWPVNWKCLAENFMEGYHLTPVHLNTLHPMTPTKLCEKIPGGTGYTGYKSHYSENFEGREPFHPDMTNEERNQSMMVWIYPSFVAAVSPNSTVYMSITPAGAEALQTRWGVAAREELFDTEGEGDAKARYEFAASFNAEDKARLIDMQRGLHSRFSGQGPMKVRSGISTTMLPGSSKVRKQTESIYQQ